MKTITFSFCAMFCVGFTQFAQQQGDSIQAPIVDSIIAISRNPSNAPLWNYSGVDFSHYPNTTAIDLNVNQNIQALAVANNTLTTDSVVGDLPTTNLMDGNLSFTIVGSYVYKKGKQGSLVLTTDTLNAIQQVVYTEKYFLLHQNDSLLMDTVAYYDNTYYSFLNASSNERIFEVFDKKRTLKGLTSWAFYGISLCASCINNTQVPDIQLQLSPNTTSDLTTISFTLPFSTDVSISLSNQTNTVNEILYTGPATEGYNEFQLMTEIYSTGSYTLTVNTANGQYSSTLVIL